MSILLRLLCAIILIVAMVRFVMPYLIAPSGRVLLQSETGRDHVISAEINPGDAIPDLATRKDF